MYLYLLLNLGAFILPFLFSFHPKLKFYIAWKWFLPANLLISTLFIVWDAWFTHMGVWGFNQEYVIGLEWNGLPLEEILFFICIPFASIFTLHYIRKIYPGFKLHPFFRNSLTALFITISLCTATVFHTKMYTFVALTICAFSLLLAHFYLKRKLDHFYLMYAIVLIPFFIINGILTGTGIPGEVVWYNPDQIIGIRMLTIPVEDTFYGFTLLLLNFIVSERLKEIFNDSANFRYSANTIRKMKV